jgi:hypothetical protein
MSIQLTCSCGQVLEINEQHAGRDTQCPKCNKVLKVPEKTVSSPVVGAGGGSGPSAPTQDKASGRAITSMILGIAGLVCCGLLAAIPALILGKIELNAIKRGEASAAGTGLAFAGFIMGIIGICIQVIVIIVWIFGMYFSVRKSGGFPEPNISFPGFLFYL